MEDKKLEILYDHYKVTFENQKGYLKKRNTYTLICLVLITLFAFQISSPAESVDVSEKLIKNNLGDVSIDFWYINNILTFGLLWIVIMYFQINFLIEKHYNYIQVIEKKLSEEMKSFEISREGKMYLDNYPWLSSVVHQIYSIFFPLVLIAIAIIKWEEDKDVLISPWCNGHFWFDTIFLFGIVLTTLLYLSNRHFNDFKKRRKTHPSIKEKKI